MKNLYCAFLLVIMFTSCSTPTPNEAIASASDSIIVRVINPEFFITEYDTIKNGRDLLWNFSLYEFEDGTQWRKWVDLNPVLQEPGRVWKDPATGRWIALVKKGEIFKNPQPVNFIASTKEIVTQNTVVTEKIPSYLYLFISLLALLSLAIIYFLKRQCSKQFIRYQNEGINRSTDFADLLRKLQEAENKLPVTAPVLADENWLKENNPAGNPIPLPNKEDEGQSTIQAIERVVGKKPDLIVTAKVWTKNHATKMKFSYNREAPTGLDGVVVYMGWDWSKEKKRWVEVGMVAGPCANMFQSNPEKIRKDQLFEKIELVSEQHPVIFTGENVPKNILYPKLVRLLVLQYHENNITDLRTRTGTMVEIPEGLKPGN